MSRDPQSDAEREAIQAISRADPTRILSSQNGYALTIGRLCELALRSESGASATIEEANRCYLTQFDRAERLQRECQAKQAHIDRLMLEYCPDEMTPEQIAEWKKHQMAVTPEAAAALDAAVGRTEKHGEADQIAEWLLACFHEKDAPKMNDVRLKRAAELLQSATPVPASSEDAWPTKDDYLALVKQHGELVNAWGAVRKHIGTDIIPGSRFERLIWLAEAAAAAPTDAAVSSTASKMQP